MMLKRISALMLAFLMLLSAVSCASTAEGDDTAQNPDADPAAAVSDETETEKPYLDDLPEGLTFDGATFGVLIRDGKLPDTIETEMTGEAVADAVTERTLKIEDRLDITFAPVPLPSDSGQWNTAIAGSAQAADGAYDVVMPDYWWGIELGGYYQNLNDIRYFDFEREYWAKGWNENNEFYGKLYTAVGDWSLDLILNTIGLYFNQRILEENQLDNPYDLVREDKWYHDTFLQMSEAALADADGDGSYIPTKDVFGTVYALHAGRGFLYSYGMKLGTKTDDGGWSLDYYNERFVKIYETVYNMQNGKKSVLYTTSVDLNSLFASGGSLFLGAGLESARGTQLRDMEDDFGIVPYPKLDEAQENFISFNFGTSYMAIVKGAKNPEMSAAVMEAMSAENHKTVVPALYEDALKDKYSRDSTTAEMLDILQSTVYFDFAFVNDAALGAICNVYFNNIAARNANVTSTYRTSSKLSQKYLEKLLRSYQEGE